MRLPYLIDNTLPGEAEIEVAQYEDGITISLPNEYTEHVNLTPDQATELAYVLLTLAGRRGQ